MKIGLLLNDSGVANMDLSNPEAGNVGIGGTQYCFLMLTKLLEKRYSNGEVCIFHYSDNILPKCKDIVISSKKHLLETVMSEKIDLFIVQNGQKKDFYDKLIEMNIATIVWAHNYINCNEAKWLALNPIIKRVVCVGRQEYDRYVDHNIINKMTYIYNMFSTNSIEYSRNHNYSLRVTYTGSLIPAKGFHLLAKIWKKIIKEVPEAQLSVIGGGNLYSRNAKLGLWGIADKEYEEVFMPFLCDENGDLLNSVHFHGVMGQEKIEIYKDTAVGVINPSALTETFGLSAVEMEACGIPIVTKKKFGLIDTVNDGKTGYLFDTEEQFIKYIVKLLKDRKMNLELGYNGKQYISEKFNPEVLVEEWIAMFEDIQKEVNVTYQNPNGNYFNDYKFLRIINRHIRKVFPFVPSMIDWKEKLRR